jgi:phage gp29-like protein
MAKGIYITPTQFKTLDAIALEKEIASRSTATGSFASWFNELPDPDPILQKLGESVKVYKDLMSDDQVGSTANRLMNEVEAMAWDIKPAKEMKDDDPEMELCRAVIQSLKDNGFEIEDIISQTLQPYFWGMSVFECLWDTSKKSWLPVKLELKPPEWFRYDTENNLLFKSIYDPTGIPLTGPRAEKYLKHQFFVLRNRATYENPYGDKALSKCFWPVAFKRGVLKFGMIFIERYGMPQLEIKHPPGKDGDELDKLVRSASLMIQDSVIAIPDGNTMTVHRGGEKQTGDLYKLYIDMFDAMTEKVILSNTLATSQQSKGGYSSSETGKEIVEGLGERLKKFPRLLFDKLFRSAIDLNIGSGNYPTFTTFDESEPKKEFAEADKAISEAARASGQQIKRTKNFYINRFGYKDDEFEIVEAAQAVATETVDSQQIANEIQSLNLNGAQIASAVSIVENVSAGDVPREAGINQLKVFLGLNDQQAQAVMGSAGTGKIIKANPVVNDPQPPAVSKVEPQPQFSETLLRVIANNAHQFSEIPEVNISDKLTQILMERILAPVIQYIEQNADRKTMIDELSKIFPQMKTDELENYLTNLIFIYEIQGRLDAAKETA